ncbi:phytoene desaturase family protein [Chitinophaga horti]|uniref:Phytoene desaturase family protein n=1 Tax=Chitinophaga horti TaxID=2920382 RepID=A0ABY6J7W3_9BACT|nr:phytoene desaturase family protein [Chitinophaga horti]UYQ95728.1 phytoene desaturase family protein [Chitinophaga horti]
MQKKIAIIGAGFSGLSAAAYSAQAGHEVHVFEKHDGPGGRARQLKTDNGYTFDMGPSWYWMPDIIEQFFQDFGYSASNFYELVSLNPQFDIIFADGSLEVPSDYQALKAVCEQLEPGAGKKLDAFMVAAKYKYQTGMLQFVQKPCHSWWEFVSPSIAASALKLDLLSNFRRYVKRYFSHPWLVSLMEFPVIFLGASPQKIPAMYSLMNYGGYVLGTWYPMGGMFELVRAMQEVGERQGVKYHYNQPVTNISTADGMVKGLVINGEMHHFDAVIASSDYHHTETMLKPELRNYDEKYWAGRTFAPSCLIYYLGFRQRLPRLKHHTLFFEEELDAHIDDIYEHKTWPRKPLFYACCPSKTDPSVAPEGHENLFLLMPLATGLKDDEATREQYFQHMIASLERYTGVSHLANLIDYKQAYCVQDFIQDYNAYAGNAYGLANTLSQTAVGKPAMRNKRLSNLFYTGQLTVPGPGVPPSIISGKIAAAEVNKLKIIRYENAL